VDEVNAGWLRYASNLPTLSFGRDLPYKEAKLAKKTSVPRPATLRARNPEQGASVVGQCITAVGSVSLFLFLFPINLHDAFVL
jgi:hypothetical protein